MMSAGSRVVLRMTSLVLGTGLIALTFASLSAGDAGAQNISSGSSGGRSGSSTASAEVVNLRAARRQTPIVLDAKLDEPAWQTAQAATEFTQSWPNPGKPPTEN